MWLRHTACPIVGVLALLVAGCGQPPPQILSPPKYDPSGAIGCGQSVTDPAYFFAQSVLTQEPPPDAVIQSDPAGAALLSFVRGPGSPSFYQKAQTGWKLLARKQGIVLYGQGTPHLEWQATMKDGPGGWKWTGGGACAASHPGTTTWRYSLATSDPALLRVEYDTGSCSADGPPELIQEVYVHEEPERVVLAVILGSAITGGHSCAGVGRIGHTTVRLLSPLGSRGLFDGGPVPTVPARAAQGQG